MNSLRAFNLSVRFQLLWLAFSVFFFVLFSLVIIYDFNKADRIQRIFFMKSYRLCLHELRCSERLNLKSFHFTSTLNLHDVCLIWWILNFMRFFQRFFVCDYLIVILRQNKQNERASERISKRKKTTRVTQQQKKRAIKM